MKQTFQRRENKLSWSQLWKKCIYRYMWILSLWDILVYSQPLNDEVSNLWYLACNVWHWSYRILVFKLPCRFEKLCCWKDQADSTVFSYFKQYFHLSKKRISTYAGAAQLPWNIHWLLVYRGNRLQGTTFRSRVRLGLNDQWYTCMSAIVG